MNLYGKETISAESLEFEDDISDSGILDIPIHAFDMIIADDAAHERLNLIKNIGKR